MRLLASTTEYIYIAGGRDVLAIPLHTASHAHHAHDHGHGHSHSESTEKCGMHVLHAHTSVEKQALILTIAVSKCKTLLIAGYDDKSIVSWDLRASASAGSNGEAAGYFKIRKKPQNITTATYTTSTSTATAAATTTSEPSSGKKSRSVVLVSDKFGEVHALQLDLKQAVMITGHSTSVITDMVCCTAAVPSGSSSSSGSGSGSGDNLLITCDRDEKIRVSNFPAAHLIHTYCLHHRYVCPCSCSYSLIPYSDVSTCFAVIFTW